MTDETTYRKTMVLAHGSGYNRSEHRVNANKVLNYLIENPTLDESKPALSYDGATYGPCGMGIGVKLDYTSTSRLTASRTKVMEASRKAHAIPFDKLREFIMQHPQLRVVYENKKPTVQRTKTVKEIIERPLAMTDDELAEMTIALQRQQHIRNEYIRRAYIAVAKSEATGNKEVYQRELDAQLKGMATLRTFMERLEIPMDDWMNRDLALAQLSLIEAQEVTDDLHV